MFFWGAPPRRRKMLRLRAREVEFRAFERELLLSLATKVTKSAT